MNLQQLEQARAKAEENYLVARNKLADPSTDLSAVAQQAQDAWNELKRLDVEFKNTVTMKKMGEMYGI